MALTRVPSAVAAGGLTLISTTSFSAVSSFAPANGTFSATYDNYRVIISGIQTASGDCSLLIRYRASGTDDTSSNYYSQRLIGDSSSASASRQSGTNSTAVGTAGNGASSGLAIDFFNPFATKKPEILSFNNGWQTGTGTSLRMTVNSFDGTTSFDSFSLITDSSTISGICSVYGYNK